MLEITETMIKLHRAPIKAGMKKAELSLKVEF